MTGPYAWRVRQYTAIRTFGWTVGEYLDTPVEDIDWLLRIHDAHQRAENKRSQDSQPRLPDVPTVG